MPRILRRSSIHTTPFAGPLAAADRREFARWSKLSLNSLRPTAGATTFYSVNSTGDGADSNLADGVCNDGTGPAPYARQYKKRIRWLVTTLLPSTSVSLHPITLNTALPDISGNLNFLVMARACSQFSAAMQPARRISASSRSTQAQR